MSTQLELVRSLSLPEVTVLSIGNIIGAGVFLLIGSIIRYGKDNAILIVLTGFIVNAILALTYAELGSMYQSNSVEYESIRDGLGANTASVSTVLLLGFLIVSISTLALFFGSYLSDNETTQFYLALGLVFVLSLVNYFGIEGSKYVMSTIGTVKLTFLGVLIICGVFYLKMGDVAPRKPITMNAFVFTSFLAIFLFNGYDAVVKMSDEIKDPEKTIPAALIWSLCICAVIYGLILAIALSMGVSGHRPLNEIIQHMFNMPALNMVTFVVGIVTIFNTTFISMLALSRFIYGLAKDSEKPSIFAEVNERFRTPHNAILLVFVVSALLLVVGSFEYSVVVTNIFLMGFSLLLLIAVIALRVKEPDAKRPFRIPGDVYGIPVAAVLGIVIVVLYLLNTGNLLMQKWQ